MGTSSADDTGPAQVEARAGNGTPVRNTLWRAFGLLLALIAVGCALGLTGLLVDSANYNQLNQITTVGVANRTARTGIADAAATVDTQLLQPRQLSGTGAYDAGRHAFEQASMAGVPEAAFDRTLSLLWANQVNAGTNYLIEYAEPALSGAVPSRVLGVDLLERFQDANTAVTLRLTQLRSNTVAAGVNTRRYFIVAVAVLLVAGGAIATLLTVRTTRRLVRPLAGVRDTLAVLAGGNLTERATVAGPAEIREVAASVNHLAITASALDATERARNRRDEAVREVVTAVARRLDPDEVLRSAVEALGEALAADRAFFWSLEDGNLLPITIEWHRPELDPAAPQSRGVTGLAPQFASGTDVTVVHDLTADTARLPDAVVGLMERIGDRAALFAWVHDGSEVFGYLSVQTSEPRRWKRAETETVATSAREIGIAMRRARAYRQEVAAVARLTELDREREAFVHTVTHEMRTPMTSIAGFVGLLTDPAAEPLTEEQRSMLTVVERNARQVQDLIDDLLTLASVTSPNFAVDPKPLALGPVIDDACQVIAPTARVHDVTLRRETGADDAEVRGDALQLGRVLTNLMSNAVKFTPAGGTVTVATSSSEGNGNGDGAGAGPTVALSVTDTGVGIPESEQERLFTRFFRASNALRQGIPGTGLGLSLVSAVVHAHGGTVELDSTENVGTTVTVRLPQANGNGAPAPDQTR